MIQFVAAYDGATQANLSVVSSLLSDGALVKDRATCAHLQSALRARPTASLLIWSHGNDAGPKAQDGLPALPDEILDAVEPRAAWAWACHTGTHFGELLARRGWTWWGYTGVVTAPDVSDPREVSILARAFAAVISAFELGQTPDRIIPSLVELRGRLEMILVELDGLEVVSYIGYTFVLQLWDRARVWFPGGAVPFAHPNATRPLFLD